MARKALSIIKRIFFGVVILLLLLSLLTFVYMKHPKFGRKPSGERLALIKKSPNFKENKFINRKHTPELTEGNTMVGVTYEYIFYKGKRRRPTEVIPSLKTDLLNLPLDKDVLVWFGHSSYFIQIDGKKILVDPVFSGNASPIPGTVKSFNGTDRYTAEDFPPIDYLFISHDHYDHVDYPTLVALRPKIKTVICGLGVGAHFEHWGFNPEHIIEKDWYDSVHLADGFTAYTTPARHFSGRGFTRNNTLWMSYVLQTPTMKIYIGGDSGYDTHFAEIGARYGPIDLAILDNGQYDTRWRYIHTLPGEVLQAAQDLKAKRLFPVHSSKFVLANHAWDEPLKKVTELNKDFNIPLITPMIGELVHLKDEQQPFQQWWTGIE